MDTRFGSRVDKSTNIKRRRELNYRHTSKQSSSQKRQREATIRSSCHVFWIGAILIISLYCLLLNQAAAQTTIDNQSVVSDANNNIKSANSGEQQQQQQPQSDQKNPLEAELNSIVQQHDSALDGSNKLLAEAIISRLMVDNLTGSSLLSGNGDFESNEAIADSTRPNSELLSDSDGNQPITAADLMSASDLIASTTAAQNAASSSLSGPTGPDAMRLKKLLSLLQNYEATATNQAGGQVYNPFPILPSSQVATMKRAALKMNNYLQGQQTQTHHNQPRQLVNYARNTFDFGLGKRPDSGFVGNFLRLGDSLGVNGGGQIQAVSQFGKRPSAHRYDFGLGKRVASPAYPRFDFGLGKRAPSRIRYDFGLGK